MADDDRLTPFHISLYITLFQFWNLNRFNNPISIARQETMRLAKIGSVNTYIKCIKELDKWAYLKYEPSHNPLKGSLIYLFNFNTTTNNATDISTNTSSDKTTKKTKKQLVIPSINSLNITNNINSVNDIPPTNDDEKNNNSKNGSKSESNNSKEKSCAKKESKTKSRQIRPLLQEIKTYFEQNSWQSLEAEKFYNYFESNGWLVGGKTPMKNWQAAAKNWILNSNKFNDGKTDWKKNVTSSGVEKRNNAGKLHASTDKNFNEPL